MTYKSVEISLYLLAGLIALVMLTARLPDLVIYNASASVPEGLYVRSDAKISIGAFVTVRAENVAPAYARSRAFTDVDDRFIKRVAALAPSVVCADHERISIDGMVVALRMSHDRAGRTLPTWTGCRRLRDEAFLLGDTADSFDGRYWGPVSLQTIEQVWRKL